MPVKLFNEFFKSEKAGGITLCLCAIVSLLLANTSAGVPYIAFWKLDVAGHHLDHWINDGLMAIFFLLVGLELKREIYTGELSTTKKALLPIFAATGGMLVPAGIHLLLNYNTPTQAGAGIPMATDIAFALGALSLLGKRVPTSLKIFLTALAVIDDLGAILVIAVFYSKGISVIYLGTAVGIFGLLAILNRFKIHNLVPYLIGGIVMWYCMLHSGVHATIAGVLLAFVIPFGKGNATSPSLKLEHWLARPVAFIILPVFALANTAIHIQGSVTDSFLTDNSLGIFLGLVIGKPVGILLFSVLAVSLGICVKPPKVRWVHLIGLGLLGGIGFTMSIFVTLLAFSDSMIIDASKIAIIGSSVVAGVAGFVLLRFTLKSKM